jgi:hypothetical protein
MHSVVGLRREPRVPLYLAGGSIEVTSGMVETSGEMAPIACSAMDKALVAFHLMAATCFLRRRLRSTVNLLIRRFSTMRQISTDSPRSSSPVDEWDVISIKGPGPDPLPSAQNVGGEILQ